MLGKVIVIGKACWITVLEPVLSWERCPHHFHMRMIVFNVCDSASPIQTKYHFDLQHA